MSYFDVFLSHDTQDYNLVDRIWKILNRININAYMYERDFPFPLNFLKKARRSLRKGGRCIVTLEVLDSLWFRLAKKLGLKVPKHERHYFTNEVITLFQKAGFSNIRIEPVANVFLGFYLFLWYMTYPTPLSQIFRYAPSVLTEILMKLDKKMRSKFLVLVVGEA